MGGSAAHAVASVGAKIPGNIVALGFERPLGATVRDVFASASAAGLGARDDAALVEWLTRPA